MITARGRLALAAGSAARWASRVTGRGAGAMIGGLVAMTKSMAKEFSDRGVRINVLTPGGVETPMAVVPFPEDANMAVLGIIPHTPMGFSTPAEIARLAFSVATQEFGKLSGAVIAVDGAST